MRSPLSPKRTRKMADEQGAIPEALERLFDQAFTDGIAAGKSDDESILAGSSAVYARSALTIVAADRLTDTGEGSFQDRVQPWLMSCFGEMIAGDREERNHRFLEEALELVQACGCTASEAHQLVDYVFGRDVGDPPQEVGGVMVTLAALCLANDLDMHANGETELARIWTKVEAIRAKQAAKPKHSPLPQAATHKTADAGAMRERCAKVADDLASIAERGKLHPHPLAIDTNEAWRRVEDACKDIAAAIRNLPDAGEPL